MYQGINHIAHVHADERRRDFLAEAAHERRLAEARRGAPPPAIVVATSLRHQLGTMLVAVGRKLQHSPVPAPADQPAALGSLRPVR